MVYNDEVNTTRLALEMEITKLINTFQKYTGYSVEGVFIHKIFNDRVIPEDVVFTDVQIKLI